MDYHQDRFDDASLLIYKNEKLIAVFPANKVESIIHSHQGLSYGGLILQKKASFNDAFETFKAIISFYKSEKFQTLNIKLIPEVYQKLPSNEIDYFLFLIDAKLTRRDVSSTIEYTQKLKIQSNRLEGKKKAIKNDLIISEDQNFKVFWNQILVPNLKEKYQAKPVHSLNEIELLHSKFKENIKQFNVYKNNEIVAGATIFETENVAHVQYISANNDKQQLGSLDFLFEHLINSVYKEKKYFDFGISNENQGQNINQGLLFWKEGFGARTTKQDFYTIDLQNVKDLNAVFI